MAIIVSEKKIFQSLHSENPFFGPCDLLTCMQPTGTIYITYVGDQPKINSCEVSSKSAKGFGRRSRLKQKWAGPQGVGSTDQKAKIYITFVEDH